MSEYEIREPIQKRSIEKKEKIIESGFELICEKGYYNTNTAEIAKNAGVSTGIVYQYFKDKHDILIDALKKYADNGCPSAGQTPRRSRRTSFPSYWEACYPFLFSRYNSPGRDYSLIFCFPETKHARLRCG